MVSVNYGGEAQEVELGGFLLRINHKEQRVRFVLSIVRRLIERATSHQITGVQAFNDLVDVVVCCTEVERHLAGLPPVPDELDEEEAIS